MNLVPLLLCTLFVYSTISPGITQASVISHPTSLQEFYNALLSKELDDLDEERGLTESSKDVTSIKRTTLPSLQHLLNSMSDSDTSQISNLNDYEYDPYNLVTIRKRASSDAKRTQDMSRLAMRILKRGGQATSRVAMRILKKRGKGNAARIAMRVLKKRESEEPRPLSRVTRASPYQHIGGYLGGKRFHSTFLPLGLPNLSQSFYESSNNRDARSEDPTYDDDDDKRSSE